MKRIYEKPMAIQEAFIANEYVAACYSLACSVGSGNKGDKGKIGGDYTDFTQLAELLNQAISGVNGRAGQVPLCCGDRKWSEILAGGSGRRYSGGLSV